MAPLSGLRIPHSHELWCRLAAVTPFSPLALEYPYAVGTTLKSNRKKKKERKKERERERGREGGREGRKEGRKERKKGV